MELAAKLDAARAELAARDGALVAFSGGVDSGVVVAPAHDALGDDAVACTARSETLPDAELADARRVTDEIGVRHGTVEFSELDDPDFVANDGDRCYHCRTMRLSAMFDAAERLGVEVDCDGTNADDPGAGHRPGLQAVRELDVYSPLLAHDVTKDEVREAARRYDLSVAEKPSMACLSSRIPTGVEVAEQRLTRVERAERLLRDWGFAQFRVRDHDDLARIEVGADELDAALDPEFARAAREHLLGPRIRPRHARPARLRDREREPRERHRSRAVGERPPLLPLHAGRSRGAVAAGSPAAGARGGRTTM